MTETPTNWLTQDAFDRLKAEMEDLKGPRRTELARRIEEARLEGDLKENGAYHAAKDEQGKMEARIRQLDHLLRHATVGEAPPDDGIVEPGMLIEANVGGRDLTFLLGHREISDGSDNMAVYSEQSPLGAAIHGKRQGEQVSYLAPNGKTIEVTIISAKPYAK